MYFQRSFTNLPPYRTIRLVHRFEVENAFPHSVLILGLRYNLAKQELIIRANQKAWTRMHTCAEWPAVSLSALVLYRFIIGFVKLCVNCLQNRLFTKLTRICTKQQNSAVKITNLEPNFTIQILSFFLFLASGVPLSKGHLWRCQKRSSKMTFWQCQRWSKLKNCTLFLGWSESRRLIGMSLWAS